MILGFGKTEIDTAYRIIEECYDAMKSATDKKETIQKIKDKYDKAEKENSKLDRSEAPGRYSYFWFVFNRIYDDKCIVEFKFSHINRNHALSPDGWALLQTKWMLNVDEEEYHIFKEA